MTLTPEDLKAIRERCEAATEGPWHVNQFKIDVYANVEGEGAVPICEDVVPKNATFIAHAREDVPRLLEEISELRVFLGDVFDFLSTDSDKVDVLSVKLLAKKLLEERQMLPIAKQEILASGYLEATDAPLSALLSVETKEPKL